jgi:hypothetical protein
VQSCGEVRSQEERQDEYPSWQDYEYYYYSSMSIHFQFIIHAQYQFDGTTEAPSLEQLQGQTACTR